MKNQSRPDMRHNTRVGIRRIAAMAAILSCMIAMPQLINAQANSGSMVGAVSDSSGAAIPNATVTVTNLRTNEQRSMKTNSTGGYRFVDLPPANYKVEVQRGHFKTFVAPSVAVQIDNTLRVDASLQIGETTQTVTVTSEPPLLQTDSGTLGSEVEGQVVQQMPLNGRNPMNLIALAPGVVPEGSTAGSASLNSGGNHTIQFGWNNYQVAGGIAGYSATYIDGAPVNMLGDNSVGLIPIQDAVQEFKVTTNAASAEFGRYGGGVIEMVTKSGSNKLHGSVYEYARNTILNANTFFSDDSDQPKAAFHQNQYGVAVGGPIKRDKLFFFFSWENYALRTASASPTNVPTAAMQSGVFDKPIKDPTGKCAIEANTPSVGEYTIPQSCFDATSAVMAKYFPLPNSTANPAFNYVSSPGTGDNTYSYDGRVDYNLSSKNLLFGRYAYWRLGDIGQNEFNDANGFPTAYASTHNTTHSAVIGDTYALSSSTVFDGRLSYIREHYQNLSPSLGKVNLATFGPAYANLASQVTVQLLPNVLFAGADSLYSFLPMAGYEDDVYQGYALDVSATKLIGHHTLKAGGELRYMDHGGTGNSTNASSKSTYTASLVGDEFAAFLLGEFNNDSIETVHKSTTFNYSQALYITDTWQVNNSFTINAGLRWELPGGIAEKQNRDTVILPNTVDPSTGDLGAVALVDSQLYPSRSVEPYHYDFFGPRLGFAERMGDKTVFRGGYGLTYLPPDLPSGLMAFTSPVAAATTTSVNGAVPQYLQANPFPSGILQPTGRSNPTFSKSLLGQVVSGPVPTSKYPYMQQWNFAVNQQLPGNWVTNLVYLGAKGTHLPELGSYQSSAYNVYGINELSSQYYSLGAALLQPSPTDPSITLGQSLRPYPQFQDLQNTADYSGSSSFNGFEASVLKNFKAGGTISAYYSWSKLIDDTDTLQGRLELGSDGLANTGFIQDFNNKKAERSISSGDIPNRAVIDYVLNLPFGKDESVANFGGVAGAFVSGWSVNGITTFQTGFPLAISYTSNALTTNFGAGTLRPNYVAGCKKQLTGSPFQKFRSGAWFNAACFTYPGNYALGDEPRVDGSLRAQGIDNFDFSFTKATPIHGAVNLDLRFEFFNLFNHPQLLPPGTQMAGTDYNLISGQNNTPRLVQISARLNF